MNIKTNVETNVETALSFDDVLIIPRKGILKSRDDANLETKLCNGIKLKVPIISSNMDTVTEDKMAIAMARAGGLGIIHRYCSIEHQVAMVSKVKRSENFIIQDPYTIYMNETLKDVRNKMNRYSVGSLIVLDHEGKFQSIVTSRDIRFQDDPGMLVEYLMSVQTVWTGPEKSIDEYQNIMKMSKVKKLPIIDSYRKVCGLVCAKDILTRKEYPNATRDSNHSLMVGAAIGLDDMERAGALIDAGVDTLVLDIAHGHCDQMIEAIKKFKTRWPDFPLGAGNVATKEGFRDLSNSGANWIKIGVGSGSVCKTRIVAGAGMPTFQSLIDCSDELRNIIQEHITRDDEIHHIGIVSDGGIKTSGDIAKSIGVGADAVMLGSLLAGTEESPGVPVVKNGKKVKIIRGMAGFGANWDRNKPKDKIVPEGVEGFVDFKGPVGPIIDQLAGGLKSGMSYSGVNNIQDMQTETRFYRQTNSGLRESHPHDLKQI